MLKFPDIPNNVAPELYQYFVILQQNIAQLENKILKLNQLVQDLSSSKGVS